MTYRYNIFVPSGQTIHEIEAESAFDALARAAVELDFPSARFLVGQYGVDYGELSTDFRPDEPRY